MTRKSKVRSKHAKRIVWTDNGPGVHPRKLRARNGNATWPNATALWQWLWTSHRHTTADLHRGLRECGDEQHDLTEVVYRLGSSERPPRTKDPVIAGACVAGFRSPEFVQYFAWQHGRAFALASVLAAESLTFDVRTVGKREARWVLPGRSPDWDVESWWFALRAAIAAATNAQYRDAVAYARKARRAADFDLRCRVSFAFPREEAWARRDANAWLTDCPKSGWAGLLFGSLAGLRATRRFAVGIVEHKRMDRTAAMQLDTLVDGLGPDASSVLNILWSGRRRHAYHIAAAMSHIRSPEAARFFVERLDQHGTRQLAEEYLRSTPEFAIPALGKRKSRRASALRNELVRC